MPPIITKKRSRIKGSPNKRLYLAGRVRDRKQAMHFGAIREKLDLPSACLPIASIPVPAAVVVNGLIKAANAAFLELLGYGEKDLLDKPFGQFYEGMPSKELLEKLKRAGTLRGIEINCITRGGGRAHASFSASVLPDLNGAFLALVEDLRGSAAAAGELKAAKEELNRRNAYLDDFREGVLRMLRDLDSSEKELGDAYEKLKDTQAQLIQSSKMTALGELAAGVAHELNQPLTVIKGLAENLLRTIGAQSPQYEKMKLIVEASKKMDLVIRHLRIFSRSDPPSLSPVDLNKVIKDAFVIVNDLLLTHSIEVNLNLSTLPLVLGSSNRLEQVVINLVTNAKDAMPCGGVLEISTRTIETRGIMFARMTFHDRGSGIPEEIIGRIFDPFFTTKEPGKGTGLGLSISYGIIKEHNGDISVESRPGKGTTFHITIPAINRH